MPSHIARHFLAALLSAAVAFYAADKPRPAAPVSVDPYAEVQPATESLDLNMVSAHSR